MTHGANSEFRIDLPHFIVGIPGLHIGPIVVLFRINQDDAVEETENPHKIAVNL